MYDNNDKITYTVRVTGTSATQVFLCPYGQNVRFMLKKIMIYNEQATPTSVKIFDQNVATSITDPPTQGSSTTPMITLSVPTSGGLDYRSAGLDSLPELIFFQGMAVVASQGTIEIVVTVIEM